MNISYSLLLPYATKLENDIQDLDRKLSATPSEACLEVRSTIHQKLQQIQNLKHALTQLHQKDRVAPSELYEIYHEIKLDLHTAFRKWKKILSNEARHRKLREKRTHAAALVA